MLINISEIQINEDRRVVNNKKVEELAESIREIGLINPITVQKKDSGYILIAGMHRIKAFERLGIKEIKTNIINGTELEMELIEIDENLIRNELHYTEIDELTARRKEIYELMYPETKHGGDRKSEEIKSRIPTLEKPSFVTDTSGKTGKSETIIKEGIYRANNLIPQAKEVLKEKNITKTEATKLSREEPEQQKKVIDLISTGQVKRVDEAKRIIDPEVVREYEEKDKQIEKEHKNHRLVASLINEVKFLDIDSESIEDYLNLVAVESFKTDFVKNCDRLIDKLNEMKAHYNNANKIRRVK